MPHSYPVDGFPSADGMAASWGYSAWFVSGAQGESIYLGTAIVAAHNLELAQEWSGCILSKEVVDRFPDEIETLERVRLARGLSAPAKGAKAKNRSVEPGGQLVSVQQLLGKATSRPATQGTSEECGRTGAAENRQYAGILGDDP